jgi:hypothetical protein
MSLKNIGFLALIMILTVGCPGLGQPNNPFTCIWHCTGADSGEGFGSVFESIKDQNYDGYDDFLVSSKENVYLYFGGNPLDTIPDLVFENAPPCFTPTLGFLGHIDDNSDLSFAISQHRAYPYYNDWVSIYYGGNLLDTIPEFTFYGDYDDLFGLKMGSGDVNGDGYDDVIITNPNGIWPIFSGKLYIYFGGAVFDTIPDITICNLDMFYISNVNGDGYDDFIAYEDGVFLFWGGSPMDTIPDWEFYPTNWEVVNTAFIVPNLNVDEYSDIVVNVNQSDYTRTYVFYGGETINPQPDLFFYGELTTLGIAYAGDVNADGCSDLISSEMYASYSRFIAIYYGDSLIWAPSFLMYNSGWWVDYMGDINGDGVDDFGFCADMNIPNYQGKVYIFSDTSLSYIDKPQINLSPASFYLNQNYPNPFNSSTVISFTINEPGIYSFYIYNSQGKLINRIFNQYCQTNSTIKLLWDGVDKYSNPLASGIYFGTLKSKKLQKSIKMEIIR